MIIKTEAREFDCLVAMSDARAVLKQLLTLGGISISGICNFKC